MTRRHDFPCWTRNAVRMDEVKHTYRDVETVVKKTVRGIDGTDLRDRVGNAGDEARKNLGNLGDDVRRAGHRPKVARTGDRT
jgi:hypothetical protein